MSSDETTERGRPDTDDEANHDVSTGEKQLAVLDEALGFEHPGRERRVGTERRGAGEQEAGAGEPETDEESEQRCPRQVDDQGAEWEVAAPVVRRPWTLCA